MFKYESFCEYLQCNYVEELQYSLTPILRRAEETKANSKGVLCEDIYINGISIAGSTFTKNKIDYVEFETVAGVDYSVLRDVFSGRFDRYSKWFCIKMGGSFDDGFSVLENKACKGGGITEKLTSGLVPVMSCDTLDSYAEAFLREFWPSALEEPMALPIEKMLAKEKIKYHYAPLESDVFAKTYFAEDEAVVYAAVAFGKTTTKKVHPGTILINPTKAIEQTEGAFRNTIIHELVHWYFHRNYFALRRCLNPEDTYVACCKGKPEIFKTDIEWMEWQARSLAPRILMPKKTALLEYDILTTELENVLKESGLKMSDSEWHSMILDSFAAFFDVSRESARIRLIELGKTGFDGVKKYIDGDYIIPYTYKKRSLKRNQTYTISEKDLYDLLLTNIQLRDALRSEKLIYSNKLLVVNNPKYFDAEKYELTPYALSHVEECCVVFEINYQSMSEESRAAWLCSGSKFNKVTTDPEAVGVLLAQADASAAHYEMHKKELPLEFSKTLEYHYQKAKEAQVVTSYDDFEFQIGITAKTLRSYVTGNVLPDRITIIKMCLVMRMSAPYIIDLLQKSDQQITLNSGDNLILFTIIYGYQRIGLEETYRQLEKTGRGYILNLPEAFIKEISI